MQQLMCVNQTIVQCRSPTTIFNAMSKYSSGWAPILLATNVHHNKFDVHCNEAFCKQFLAYINQCLNQPIESVKNLANTTSPLKPCLQRGLPIAPNWSKPPTYPLSNTAIIYIWSTAKPQTCNNSTNHKSHTCYPHTAIKEVWPLPQTTNQTSNLPIIKHCNYLHLTQDTLNSPL